MPSSPIRSVCLLLALVVLLAASAPAAGGDPGTPRVHAVRLDAPPLLATFVEAMENGTAPRTPMSHVVGFRTRLPRDDEASGQRTDVYIGRDDDALHVVFLAWADDPASIRAHLVSRDRIYEDDDSLAVQLDTFRDFRRAYGLQTNPAGARQDGFWIEGNGWSLDPDFEYHLQTARTSRGYVVQYAIPFRGLDYPPGADEWGLMLMRITPATGETAFWPGYSRRIQGRMNQAAILTGMSGIPPSARGQVTPYASIDASRTGDGRDVDTRLGLDARWRLGRGGEVALTLDPDFGQIESDEPQIAANQRFELFYPEKRPFFADHARYFATPLSLLFTRRIARPDIGLRAAGQHDGLTWATLAVRDAPAGADTRHLFAGRGRHDLGPDLSLGVGVVSLDDGARNDVLSLDARWRIDGRWVLQAQQALSRDDHAGERLRGDAGVIGLQGTGAAWTWRIDHQRIDEGFRADAGFVPRRGIHDSRQSLTWRHQPARGPATSLGADLTLDYVTDTRGLRLDRGGELAVLAEFPRQGLLAVFAGPRDERLLPGEFPGLPAARDYRAGHRGAQIRFSIGPAAIGLRHATGDRINIVPPAGQAPSQGRFREASFDLSLRPGERLTNDNRVLYTRLADSRGNRVFDTLIVRSKWNWYLTPDWSLRLIGQYRRTRGDPALTRLADDEGANLDLLLAWQPSPTRAWFIGFNTDYAAFDDMPGGRPTGDGTLAQRARSVYGKFVWSFDFG